MFFNHILNASTFFCLQCLTKFFLTTGDSTLIGHLLPLGYQTKPTVKIDEFTV